MNIIFRGGCGWDASSSPAFSGSDLSRRCTSKFALCLKRKSLSNEYLCLPCQHTPVISKVFAKTLLWCIASAAVGVVSASECMSRRFSPNAFYLCLLEFRCALQIGSNRRRRRVVWRFWSLWSDRLDHRALFFRFRWGFIVGVESLWNFSPITQATYVVVRARRIDKCWHAHSIDCLIEQIVLWRRRRSINPGLFIARVLFRNLKQKNLLFILLILKSKPGISLKIESIESLPVGLVSSYLADGVFPF